MLNPLRVEVTTWPAHHPMARRLDAYPSNVLQCATQFAQRASRFVGTSEAGALALASARELRDGLILLHLSPGSAERWKHLLEFG